MMKNLNVQLVLQKEVDDQPEGAEGYAAVSNHANHPCKKLAVLGNRDAITNNAVITFSCDPAGQLQASRRYSNAQRCSMHMVTLGTA
jgi:hypothetical protein